MSKRSVYKAGYKQGAKGNVFDSWIQSVGNTVTGNMFGSKTQKTFNNGYRNGERDRRDSKKKW